MAVIVRGFGGGEQDGMALCDRSSYISLRRPTLHGRQQDACCSDLWRRLLGVAFGSCDNLLLWERVAHEDLDLLREGTGPKPLAWRPCCSASRPPIQEKRPSLRS